MAKSLISKITGSILKFTKPKYMDSEEKVNEFLAEKSESKHVRSVFKSSEMNGMQVFRYGNPNSKKTILYMHGGAYVNEINIQHHLFCYKLSKKLKAYILAPAYPLSPSHSAAETFDLITSLYTDLIKNRDDITLMGDSAGGGFVLSFAQHLKAVNLPQPKHIITFSPWVDVSMSSTPYDNENDPILGEVGLREIGKKWAGDLDTKNYKVSPLFGDNENLAKTLIFAGTDEIFYKDIKNYVEKLENDGVYAKLITGKGMFHIYPLFPIPEARHAFKEIKKEMDD
ncbi:alpha/beta hydrolase fold domain-containing protein [Methanobrevibacter sp.]|uniref:alpha/beta hydrolase fold domain-containing protein n=1 Tax=Methanobrevibacter sp. TaxID=66852 RepID=UPI0025DE112E|nr:alpha/beta hydrolase [Methanobrevibacter sp.]MBQ2831237.1 alpha/beta hydrolase [Methanobrevibacter sp.]